MVEASKKMAPEPEYDEEFVRQTREMLAEHKPKSAVQEIEEKMEAMSRQMDMINAKFICKMSIQTRQTPMVVKPMVDMFAKKIQNAVETRVEAENRAKAAAQVTTSVAKKSAAKSRVSVSPKRVPAARK